MKERNPFVIYGYEGAATFCDREDETLRLENAIANGRNVTLLAERRIGKTGLISHCFADLSGKGEFSCIYVDVFATSNLSEFTTKLASAIVGSLDSRIDKALDAAARFFKSFRPGITVDPVTGASTFSFALQPQAVETTLKECFSYLAGRGDCVVAIDEFQQIASYPEKGVDALLRSYIQFLPHARFIFAGSRHHMMMEMFSSAKRPFFNSTQTIPLERIDPGKYFEFARRHMASAAVSIEPEAFSLIYSLFDGITWYVQLVLNRLYERRSATESDVRHVVDELIAEKNWEFAALLKSVPDGSARLLKAVAKEGRVKEPTSGEFIMKHSLRSPSSVHLSLRTLVNDELLYGSDDGYVVYDRLFGFWLARLP